MTSNVIERTRQVHQDLSEQELTLLDTLLTSTSTSKGRLLQEHATHSHLAALLTLERSLLHLYTDTDGIHALKL